MGASKYSVRGYDGAPSSMMMVVSGRGSAATEEVRMLRVVVRRMSAFMLSSDI